VKQPFFGLSNSVVCHLSSDICPATLMAGKLLSSVICLLSSVICYLSSVVWNWLCLALFSMRPAKAFIFIILYHKWVYIHLGFLEIGFVLHKIGPICRGFSTIVRRRRNCRACWLFSLYVYLWQSYRLRNWFRLTLDVWRDEQRNLNRIFVPCFPSSALRLLILVSAIRNTLSA